MPSPITLRTVKHSLKSLGASLSGTASDMRKSVVESLGGAGEPRRPSDGRPPRRLSDILGPARSASLPAGADAGHTTRATSLLRLRRSSSSSSSSQPPRGPDTASLAESTVAPLESTVASLSEISLTATAAARRTSLSSVSALSSVSETSPVASPAPTVASPEPRFGPTTFAAAAAAAATSPAAAEGPICCTGASSSGLATASSSVAASVAAAAAAAAAASCATDCTGASSSDLTSPPCSPPSPLDNPATNCSDRRPTAPAAAAAAGLQLHDLHMQRSSYLLEDDSLSTCSPLPPPERFHLSRSSSTTATKPHPSCAPSTDAGDSPGQTVTPRDSIRSVSDSSRESPSTALACRDSRRSASTACANQRSSSTDGACASQRSSSTSSVLAACSRSMRKVHSSSCTGCRSSSSPQLAAPAGQRANARRPPPTSSGGGGGFGGFGGIGGFGGGGGGFCAGRSSSSSSGRRSSRCSGSCHGSSAFEQALKPERDGRSASVSCGGCGQPLANPISPPIAMSPTSLCYNSVEAPNFFATSCRSAHDAGVFPNGPELSAGGKRRASAPHATLATASQLGRSQPGASGSYSRGRSHLTAGISSATTSTSSSPALKRVARKQSQHGSEVDKTYRLMRRSVKALRASPARARANSDVSRMSGGEASSPRFGASWVSPRSSRLSTSSTRPRPGSAAAAAMGRWKSAPHELTCDGGFGILAPRRAEVAATRPPRGSQSSVSGRESGRDTGGSGRSGSPLSQVGSLSEEAESFSFSHSSQLPAGAQQQARRPGVLSLLLAPASRPGPRPGWRRALHSRRHCSHAQHPPCADAPLALALTLRPTPQCPHPTPHPTPHPAPNTFP